MKKEIKIIISACLALMLITTSVLMHSKLQIQNEYGFETAINMNEGITTEIQTRLKNWGYYDGPITGYYGPLTTEGVKYFQSLNGLTPDGVVGPKTLAKIGINANDYGATTNSNDIYLLAKAVYSESRGEPYVGQVAVAAIVLNRVRSSQFPNTVSGVIYQPWAFTAVHDGQFDLEPNATAYQAARDAMNGWDPTYGSLFYYNPATATSSWIFSRETVVEIGRHVFAR